MGFVGGAIHSRSIPYLSIWLYSEFAFSLSFLCFQESICSFIASISSTTVTGSEGLSCARYDVILLMALGLPRFFCYFISELFGESETIHHIN